MGDADERDGRWIRRRGCSRNEAGELADAELAVDFDAGVDFLAVVAVGSKR